VLNGDFDGSHVAASSEVEILVKQVTVAVLLRGPAAAPASPGGICIASRIITSFKGIEKGLVGWESFFCNHVADQDNQEFIRDSSSLFTELLDLIFPSLLAEVWKIVLGLPSLVSSLEELCFKNV
jgi:hypothetical protein